jgi:multidrug resistance efflux pump
MPKNTKTSRIVQVHAQPTGFLQRIKLTTSNIYGKIVHFFKTRPLLSFFVSLGVLLLLIALASFLGRPKNENATEEAPAKKVSVFSIGSAPKISLPAKIEKSGVIKIVAQMPGIVYSIPVTEGMSVDSGSSLVNLSSNYQGGDVAGVQAQIAQQQYSTTQDTYNLQKDLISQQREVATQSSQNTENLRQISQQSVDETQSLIDLNQQILSTLDQNLSNYSASNAGGMNDALILQTQSLKSQFQSGANQLQSALRQTQYQTDTNNPPSMLNNLQKDITLKQLDIQDKMLDLNKEVSGLQLSLAQLNESFMHPVSPVAGTVERVYVTPGQSVTPGTPLLTISANDVDITAVVSVPNQIAQSVSRIETSMLHIGNKSVPVMPRYISQEATDGQFYTIFYTIPAEYQRILTNAGYISIDIPIGLPDTGKTIPFIPLDSLYQTQEEAYVYVMDHGKVKSKTVTLGNVYGRFVEVTSGISDGDLLILDRNVVAGDRVTNK